MANKCDWCGEYYSGNGHRTFVYPTRREKRLFSFCSQKCKYEYLEAHPDNDSNETSYYEWIHSDEHKRQVEQENEARRIKWEEEKKLRRKIKFLQFLVQGSAVIAHIITFCLSLLLFRVQHTGCKIFVVLFLLGFFHTSVVNWSIEEFEFKFLEYDGKFLGETCGRGMFVWKHLLVSIIIGLAGYFAIYYFF